MTSMQIKSIVLYNASGERRELEFNLGAVNIISGTSNTGKSTIIQIVNYCLGQSEFEICEGITRDAVEWYGVLYQIDRQQVFVAKPKPPAGRRAYSQVYYKQAEEIVLPFLEELTANSDDAEVIRNISRLLGVSASSGAYEYANRIASLKLTIDYAIFYLFQEKTIIANNQILFYHQQQDKNSEIIRETLPYFLGITEEEYLKAKQELDKAQSNLRSARFKLRQEENRLSTVTDMAQSVVLDAQRAGLIESNLVLEEKEIISEVLTKIVKEWEPVMAPPVADERLPQLRDELDALRREFAHKDEEINSIKSFMKEAQGYSREIREQMMRLESINLFDPQDSFMDERCPLCDSVLETPPPRITVMGEVLRNLQNELETEKVLMPELQEHFQTIEIEKDHIKRKITEKQAVVKTVIEEQNKQKGVIQRILDTNTRIDRVVGHIDFYLDMTKSVSASSELRKQVENAQEQVDYWSEQVNAHDIESEKQSTLNDIGRQMTEWANQLNLEHEGFYHFDLDKLTVVVDKHRQSVSLEQMGGRSNWLGCHLITLLALHKHFIEYKRPVPSFIILDQPAQGVYEDVMVASQESLNNNSETNKINYIFDFLFEVCEELPGFQIIVLEHADLRHPKFGNAVIDGGRWTSDKGLIPQSWIVDETTYT